MIVVLKCFPVVDFVQDPIAAATFSYETLFKEESETAL